LQNYELNSMKTSKTLEFIFKTSTRKGKNNTTLFQIPLFDMGGMQCRYSSIIACNSLV